MADSCTFVIVYIIFISLGQEFASCGRFRNPIVVARGQRRNFANGPLYFIGKRGGEQDEQLSDDLMARLRRADDDEADDSLQVRAYVITPDFRIRLQVIAEK